MNTEPLTAAEVAEIERSIDTSTTMRSDVRALCATLRHAMEIIRKTHNRLVKMDCECDEFVGYTCGIHRWKDETGSALAGWDKEKRDG